MEPDWGGRVAEAFAEAPFVVGGWDRALRLLAAETGSARGQLIGIGGPSVIPFNVITDTPACALQEFVEIDGSSPQRNFRVAASRGPFEVVHEEDYAAARLRLKDGVYDDFCRKWDIPHGIQTVLEQWDHSLIGLSVNRSAHDGVSTADQREAFAAAIPHALRAVRAQQAMDGQGAHLVAESLEALSVTAFVLDWRATVRAMTPSAERTVSAGTQLQLRDRRLHATSPKEDAALAAALRAALGPFGSERTLRLAGGPRAEPPPRTLFVSPLRLKAGSFGFAPRLLVVLRSPKEMTIHGDGLRRAFSLTAGEAQVAAQLASGLTREEIAARRGVAPSTIHTQLKAIFAKVGVGREVDLVLAVLQAAGDHDGR